MTKLDPSIYKRRNNLLRQSKVLRGILLDTSLQFEQDYYCIVCDTSFMDGMEIRKFYQRS